MKIKIEKNDMLGEHTIIDIVEKELIDIINEDDEKKSIVDSISTPINDEWVIVVRFWEKYKDISLTNGDRERAIELRTNRGISNEKIVKIIEEVVNG